MAHRREFSFGGCVYQMRVDARHAASFAALAAICGPDRAASAPAMAEVDYMHTSYLPAGRCLWLRRQIAARHLSWAISVDADTTFHAGQLAQELARVDGQVAIGLAPVRIGGTESVCNLCLTESDERVSAKLKADAQGGERRMFAEELQRVLDGDRLIASGGFGVAVFNLNWFRLCWPEPTPDGCKIDVGEDIAFCRAVRERGGLIAALAVATDHYAWGERQTR